MGTKLAEIIRNPVSWIISFYALVLMQPSLWSDDYPSLTNPKEFSISLVSDLRPVWAFSHWLFTSTFDAPLFAWLPKVIATVFLVLVYVSVVSFLTTDSDRTANSTLATCLFLPSISIFVHWSTLWQNSVALFLSVYSLKLSAYSPPSSKNFVLSSIYFTLSLLVYPPAAFASFGILAICALISLRYSTLVSRTRNFLAVALLSSFVSFFLANSIRNFLDVEAADRVKFVELQDLLEKLFYMIKLVFLSFNLFSTARPSDGIHLILPFLCFFLFLYFTFLAPGKVFAVQLQALVKSLAFASISLSPIMITADNQVELRLLAGLTIYVTFFSLLGAVHLVLNISRRVGLSKCPSSLSISISMLLIAGVLSLDRYNSFFLNTYKQNQSFVKESIQDCVISKKSKILVVEYKAPPLSRRLGTYSMSSDFISSWVPLNAPQLLDERLQNVELIRVRRDDPQISIDSCVLDLRLLYRKSQAKPFW